MTRVTFAVFFSGIYLMLFLLSLYLENLPLLSILFLLSPIMLLYLIYSVIRYGKYNGRELEKDEEWAYEDMNKDQLGTWG
ncbi:hypothetical protein [Daejeonella oryzae]|uniref:hypothetical protein n=1 Tax=Daejeonella oryzae TaxID=1122943 RepID=UPI00047D485B|nr:hypothetical protein [Daejeonella oryzae]